MLSAVAILPPGTAAAQALEVSSAREPLRFELPANLDQLRPGARIGEIVDSKNATWTITVATGFADDCEPEATHGLTVTRGNGTWNYFRGFTRPGDVGAHIFELGASSPSHAAISPVILTRSNQPISNTMSVVCKDGRAFIAVMPVDATPEPPAASTSDGPPGPWNGREPIAFRLPPNLDQLSFGAEVAHIEDSKGATWTVTLARDVPADCEPEAKHDLYVQRREGRSLYFPTINESNVDYGSHPLGAEGHIFQVAPSTRIHAAIRPVILGRSRTPVENTMSVVCKDGRAFTVMMIVDDALGERESLRFARSNGKSIAGTAVDSKGATWTLSAVAEIPFDCVPQLVRGLFAVRVNPQFYRFLDARRDPIERNADLLMLQTKAAKHAAIVPVIFDRDRPLDTLGMVACRGGRAFVAIPKPDLELGRDTSKNRAAAPAVAPRERHMPAPPDAVKTKPRSWSIFLAASLSSRNYTISELELGLSTASLEIAGTLPFVLAPRPTSTDGPGGMGDPAVRLEYVLFRDQKDAGSADAKLGVVIKPAIAGDAGGIPLSTGAHDLGLTISLGGKGRSGYGAGRLQYVIAESDRFGLICKVGGYLINRGSVRWSLEAEVEISSTNDGQQWMMSASPGIALEAGPLTLTFSGAAPFGVPYPKYLSRGGFAITKNGFVGGAPITFAIAVRI